MSERMITIPYKEYMELQTYKKIANIDDERVYIKEDAESLGNFYSWWFVYTKDQAVRDLSDKLNEARKELENKLLEEENKKASNSKSDIVINILLFCIMVALIYIIFNINYI